MTYPFKYPVLYGELAMQGKTKKGLADCLHITMAGLRYKQSMKTEGDFRGEEMRAAAAYLERPIDYLFSVENVVHNPEKCMGESIANSGQQSRQFQEA